MREPVSVWTNAAYVAAGVPFVSEGGLSTYVGLTFILLGLSSGWYHWALSTKAQLADERGMYVAFAALAVAAWVGAVPPRADNTLTLVTLALTVGLVLATQAERLNSFLWVPFLVLTGLAGVAVNVSLEASLWLLAGFVLVTLIRQLHDSSAFLKPYRDLIHGVWHSGSAVFLYIYAVTVLP